MLKSDRTLRKNNKKELDHALKSIFLNNVSQSLQELTPIDYYDICQDNKSLSSSAISIDLDFLNSTKIINPIQQISTL